MGGVANAAIVDKTGNPAENWDVPMRIALVSEIDINRKIAWSGTHRYMADALRSAGAEVEIFDPIWEFQTLTLDNVGKVIRRLGGSDPMLNRSRFIARLKAGTLQKRVKGAGFDALLAPVGSTLISEMPPGIPIIYSSDATVPLMQDYYGRFGRAGAAGSARAFASERSALQRADLLVYPTWWAANSAIVDFGIDESRILVQPFGANLSDPPARADALRPRRSGPLRLLFCGVEWERKGGDVALAALADLLASGQEAELVILGCTPPDGALSDPALARAIDVVPFLNKAIPQERQRFRDIFLDADIFILPTLAECYGLVFCEAAACGAVSFGTATGGVPEVILDGNTGRVLPPGATGGDYAKAIRDVVREDGRLQRMKHAARTDYEERLNWGVWGNAVLQRARTLGDPQSRK